MEPSVTVRSRQSATGGSISVTTMEIVQVDELPLPSTAVAKAVEVPTGKKLPGTGDTVMEDTEQLSVAGTL